MKQLTTKNKKQAVSYATIPDVAHFRYDGVTVVDTTHFYNELGFPLIAVFTPDWSKTKEEKEEIKKMKVLCK